MRSEHQCDCDLRQWRPHTTREIECTCVDQPPDLTRRRRRARALLIVFILALWAAALVSYIVTYR